MSLLKLTLGSIALLLTCSLLCAQTPDAAPVVDATAGQPAVAVGTAPAAEEVPYLTFGLNHVPGLRFELFSIPLWQYAASIIYVILAMYFARFLDWFVRKYIQRLTKKTETRIDDVMLELLHGPVRVISFVFLLHVGLHVFHWPGWLETYMSMGLKLAVAGSITWMLMKTVDATLNSVRQRADNDRDRAMGAQLFPVLGRMIKAIIFIIAALVTAQNLGFEITGLLASVSVGGLAIGLAAQDSLANVFGAVTIFLDKPFRIGDRIVVDKTEGVVETIGMRSTRVRNLDGHLVTIPNRSMGNAAIVNITARGAVKTEMNLGMPYSTAPDKVQQAVALILAVCRAHPSTNEVTAGFNKFSDSSMNILVTHWSKELDAKLHLEAMQAINLEIKRRFDAEGLELANPTRTVLLRNDPRV